MGQGISGDQIFAHRGYWKDENLVPNSAQALAHAAYFKFSIETDIRNDSSGDWVAHDACEIATRIPAHSIFDYGTRVAINMKSDGLSSFALGNISHIESSNSFFFDGSLPQMLTLKKLSIPHALRLSEYERDLPWSPPTIWLDAFESDWWLEIELESLVSSSEIIIVSPELHGRAPEFVWDAIFDLDVEMRSRISICTDRPLDLLNWNSK